MTHFLAAFIDQLGSGFGRVTGIGLAVIGLNWLTDGWLAQAATSADGGTFVAAMLGAIVGAILVR